MIKKSIIFVALAMLMFSGCAKPSIEEADKARLDMDMMANTTIQKLVKDKPEIQKELDASVGHLVINWRLTKIPIVGGGSGNAVVVDSKTGERAYGTVKRFDLGAGIGARSFKNLIIINDIDLFNEIKSGHFIFDAGAEASAGKAAASADTAVDGKMKIHVLIDGGGSASATIRYLTMSLDPNLN